MPTEVPGAKAVSDPALAAGPPARRGLRLALGVCAIFVVGMALNWPFAIVGAVFAALFLQGPTAPSLRAGGTLVLTAFVLLFFGFALFTFLLPYKAVFVIAQVFLLGWAFSLSVSGRSPLLVMLALMEALMMPYLVVLSPDIARALALWLPGNLALALLVAWAAFALLPPDPAAFPSSAAAAAQKFDPERRLMRMMLVTLPFVALFTLSGSGAVLTLLFVAILSQQLAASTNAGPVVAKDMLLANAAGGLAAMLAYELVVMNTNFAFMAVISLLLCFGLASWLTSGHASAPLASSALSTALILFGGAMAPFGGDVEVEIINRLFQIGAALIWVLGAFVVVDRFLPEREEAPPAPDWKPHRRAGAHSV